MTGPSPSAPRRATRVGLIAAGALIAVTAVALLVVTITTSNDRCEQAARLLSDIFVTDDAPPRDLASTLPSEDLVGVSPVDQPLDAEHIARAFSDPSLGAPLLEEHGFEAGLGRSWRGRRALASAWVLTFERVSGATAFARELVVLTCDHAERVFGVSGIRGAVGMRVRFEDGVQDEVVFSRGSMVFVVGYTYAGTDVGPTDRAQELARATAGSTA